MQGYLILSTSLDGATEGAHLGSIREWVCSTSCKEVKGLGASELAVRCRQAVWGRLPRAEHGNEPLVSLYAATAHLQDRSCVLQCVQTLLQEGCARGSELTVRAEQLASSRVVHSTALRGCEQAAQQGTLVKPHRMPSSVLAKIPAARCPLGVPWQLGA